MLVLFWVSIFIIIYTYLGYPLVLALLSIIKNHKVEARRDYLPQVTMIVTVFNESQRLERKIANTLELDYPEGKLEIIFASDASTDNTDEIIKSYLDKGISLVRSPHRGGKEHAQKCAIEQASGEVIVFSDVATILDKDGIRNIVANFADPSVGCVSSEDRFINPDGTISGEGAYVKYEMWLRSLESQINSVVGLSGSFFAARKDVCRNWPTNIPSDFNTLLNAIRSGYRGVSDPSSVGIYTNLKDQQREFERKVRTITRGISALVANRGLLNPFEFGLFAWQLLSHKLMRWLAPWLLVLALVANVALAMQRTFYRLLLAPHMSFYLLAQLGSRKADWSIVLKIPYYFVQVNHAIAVAWVKFIKGERFVTWTPSNR